MPVAPGRSVAILVEVAARNQLLAGTRRARRPGLGRRARSAARARRRRARGRRRRRPRRRRRSVRRGRPRLGTRPSRADFLVITGLSGAGKSQAIHAVEDLGYYCVDNLPLALLSDLLRAAPRGRDAGPRRGGGGHPRAALPLGVPGGVRPAAGHRRRPAVAHLPRGQRLGAAPALQRDAPAASAGARRRRSPTRSPASGARWPGCGPWPTRSSTPRTSPCTSCGRCSSGCRGDRRRRAPLVLTFESFGFKHGLPLAADLVFDVRFLPNPHFVPDLRPQTGRDRAVVGVPAAPAGHPPAAAPAHRLPQVPAAAVRRRGQELRHRRHRLHRRPPPLGLHRRGAAPRDRRRARGERPGPPSRLAREGRAA